MKAVLTIAGSDSSGGAGIQADLKTIAAHHLFGESVITALTAQNTLGVTDVLEVDPVFVGTQIDAVFDDIRPDAVKIGMVSSSAIVGAIADGLDRHKAANVVVDPVMVATSGSALIADAAVDALVRQLFPRATVITPNIPEAEVLSGRAIASSEDVEAAASLIADPLRRRLGERVGFHGRSAFRARYPHQGRPRGGRAGRRRRLPAHGRRRIGVAAGYAHRQRQHPRHRLLPLLGHRPAAWPGAFPWTWPCATPRPTWPAPSRPV